MKNKGNQKQILVSNDDNDLIEASNEFLQTLEKEFSKYKKKYKEKEKQNIEYKENTDFYFTPEELTKKSPLTILDAPWGSGKTFFIENFAKLLIDKKIQSSTFKKMIIIDAWKFSNSRDVPIEFILELSSTLLKINNKSLNKEDSKIFLVKIFKQLAPASMNFQMKLPFLNIGFTKDLTKENDKIQKVVDNIKNNEEPVLIFIDNLERLGSFSWDLLKSIIKLQEFNNYLIVLPLNLKKIKNNDYKKENGEYPIEKYIDITMFTFHQNYFGYFMDQLQNEAEATLFNDIFSESIDGENLSIREVDKSIMSNQIFSIKTTYERLKIIYQKIWKANKVIEKKLLKDFQVFLEFLKKQKNTLKRIQISLFEKNKQGKFVNFTDKFNNSIIDFDDCYFFPYIVNFDYTNDLNSFKKLINKKGFFLKDSKKKAKIKIKKLKTKITEEKEKIKVQEERIENYKKQIQLEEQKNLKDKNADVITHNTNNINKTTTWINNSNDIIDQNNNKIERYKNDIKMLDSNLSRLLTDIDNLIESLEKDKEELLNKIDNNEIKDIMTFIENHAEYNDWFNNDINIFENEIQKNIISIIEQQNL